MLKALFLLITLLVLCFLGGLLVKLWCLSKRKDRLQRAVLAGQRQLPPRRAARTGYRKE